MSANTIRIGRVYLAGDPNLTSSNVDRFARAVQVRKAAEEKSPGEFILGATPGDNFGSYPTKSGLKLLKLFCNVTTWGNGDDFSTIRNIDMLLQSDPQLHLTVANLFLSESLMPGCIKPFHIFRFQDLTGQPVKIAFTGFANDDETIYRKDWSKQGIAVGDIRNSFLAVAKKIQAENPDLFFILVHDGPGFGGNYKGNVLKTFSNLQQDNKYNLTVPGIVATGHYSPPYFKPRTVPGSPNLRIMNGGYETTALREVSIYRHLDGKISYSTRWIELTDDMSRFPKAVEIIESESKKAGTRGYTPVILDWTMQQHPIPGWKSSDLHVSETNLGNLACDLVLQESNRIAKGRDLKEPSCALLDARLFRSHLPQGLLNNLQLNDAFHTEDRIVIAELKTIDIVDLFRELASSENLRVRADYPDPAAISGGKATIRVNKIKGKSETQLDYLEIGEKVLFQNGESQAREADKPIVIATRERFFLTRTRHYENLFHQEYTPIVDSIQTLLTSHFRRQLESYAKDEPFPAISMDRITYLKPKARK